MECSKLPIATPTPDIAQTKDNKTVRDFSDLNQIPYRATYLLIVQPIQQKAQNLSDFVQLFVEEAFLRKLVIHLRAELLDALSVPVRKISGMLALKKLNHLVKIHN